MITPQTFGIHKIIDTKINKISEFKMFSNDQSMTRVKYSIGYLIMKIYKKRKSRR